MSASISALLRVLGRYKYQYLFAAFLLVGAIFFRSLEPKILQVAVDHVIAPLIQPDAAQADAFSWLPAVSRDTLGQWLLILAVAYMIIALLRGALLFASSAIKDKSAEASAKLLRDRVFAHIQRLPMSFFQILNRGELIQRSTGDIDAVKNFLKGQVLSIVNVLAIFTFAVWMIALVDPVYALFSVMLTPFIGITAYVFFQRERGAWEAQEEASDKLSQLVQENLNGIRLVAAYSRQDFEISRFHRHNDNYLQRSLEKLKLHTFFWPLSDFLGFAQISISMIAGGYFAWQGRITVGELLSCYTYMSMVAWPMRQLGRILSEMSMAQVSMGRILEIFAADTEPEDGASPAAVSGAITFENVKFGYSAEGAAALHGVSFSIEPGERVAIIGPTGAGKTTLIRLLMRLYEPDQGRILLDAQPLEQFERRALRERIGLALQKAFLFSTSIHGNIAYARPKASRDKVKSVAQQARFGEIATSFPKGYETVVGEKGVTLSGGQKQRVALARTLLTQPDILILDDVTSAVDTETEQAILNELDQMDQRKTTLIISHRVSAVQFADRVLVLDQGRLVQEGTPAELAKVPGYYQEILAIQQDVEARISSIISEQ
ncbi:MAG: ABC transporter ATP-binding protein [Bacteroidota bacterium]